MIKKKTPSPQSTLRFTSGVWLIVFIANLIVQSCIIGYNHYSGYVSLSGMSEFIVRLAIGTFFSVLMTICMLWFNFLLINRLSTISWLHLPILRLSTEFAGSMLIGFFASTLITVAIHFISPYNQGLWHNILNNGLIAIIANILIISIIEAVQFFNNEKKATHLADKLERENLQMKFDSIKNQINPHFLFNSLNVLTVLIDTNPDRAKQCVDQLAALYRYVLETIEQPVVTLEQELKLIKSYLFLQQTRYGQQLKAEYAIDPNSLHLYLPPLSLQLVVENAIKHNIISEPGFTIQIKAKDQLVFITNPYQPKIQEYKSTGIGQKNLFRRYELICDQTPVFELRDNEYWVILPLLEAE